MDESSQAGLKFFNDLSSSARNTITNVSNWYSGLSTSVRNAIDDAVNWYNGLSSSVRSGISSAVSWYDSASNNVKNIIKSSTAEIEQGLGSAYANLKNWYESINSKVRDALEDIGSRITSFIYGDDSASSQGGSNGDIDARIHDLVNVDRIFFNSNDSLKTNSAYPHITGADILNNRNMFLYAPSAFLFYTGTENNFAIDSSFTYIYNKLNARDDIRASNHIDLFKTFKII